MILTNCNCAEKVECGCTLSFSSYVTPAVSVLDVGELVASGCTIDDYVIDWYKDGVYHLTSASSTGLVVPEATAFHPFTGLAAIPIEPGTYVPVIRFVIIDGEKIFTVPKLCQKWCDMTIDLPEIEINSITCSITGGSPPANYSYKIAYATSSDWVNAERKVRFDLDDATPVLYFAVYFYAEDVVDQIDIYLNGEDEEDLLTSWQVGTKLSSATCSSMPYRANYSFHQFIVTIPEYETGSYLIIKVTPSVEEPSNHKTEWWAAFKCLYTDISTECAVFQFSLRSYNISTFQLVDEPTICRWSFYATLDNAMPVPATDYPNLSKYLRIGNTTYNSASWDNTTKKLRLMLSYGRSPSTTGYQWENNGAAYFETSVGTITLNKTGNVFTLTFADNADYLIYKNRWDSINVLWQSEFVDDNTDWNYYRFFYFNFWHTTGDQCGDDYSISYLYFHIKSTVVWGADYMQITAFSPTMGLTPVACDAAYTSANSYITSSINTYNLGNFTVYTRCRNKTPFSVLKCYYVDRYSTDVNGGHAVYIYGNSCSGVCSFDKFCTGYTGYFFGSFFRVKITDYGDPANNYEVYDWIAPDATCYTYNRPDSLVYKIEGGDVKYPV